MLNAFGHFWHCPDFSQFSVVEPTADRKLSCSLDEVVASVYPVLFWMVVDNHDPIFDIFLIHGFLLCLCPSKMRRAKHNKKYHCGLLVKVRSSEPRPKYTTMGLICQFLGKKQSSVLLGIPSGIFCAALQTKLQLL